MNHAQMGMPGAQLHPCSSSSTWGASNDVCCRAGGSRSKAAAAGCMPERRCLPVCGLAHSNSIICLGLWQQPVAYATSQQWVYVQGVLPACLLVHLLCTLVAAWLPAPAAACSTTQQARALVRHKEGLLGENHDRCSVKVCSPMLAAAPVCGTLVYAQCWFHARCWLYTAALQ